METLLVDFRLDRPTWFYLSLLLVVAVFFRFGRFWSLRNLDLSLLLVLSPGLLFLDTGRRLGYAWLFGASAVIVVRLLLDPLFERRPRLTQNLNTAGLIFLLGACATFHVASILTTDRLPASAVRTADRADQLVHRRDASKLTTIKVSSKGEAPAGPAATVLTAPAVGLSKAVALTDRSPADEADSTLPVRIAAILAHAAVVSALLILGWRLFGDVHSGVSMATLYLLLPCTAYNSAHVNHVLPCGLILWAVVLFRKPFAAGGLLGLACGTLTFPLFLLPIWITFYGRQNALRFATALGMVGVALLGSISLTSANPESFKGQVFGMIDWSMLRFGSGDTTGAWAGIDGVYRMPVFVTFLVMIGWLCRWPRVKTVEPLLARSAAVIVGIQFWYPQDGGVYLLWYVPLLLAVMFRPTLTQLTAPPATRWISRREQAPAASAERPVVASAMAEPVRPLFR